MMQFSWFDVVVGAMILLYAWQSGGRAWYLAVSEALAWIAAFVGAVWGAERMAIFMVMNLGLWEKGSWWWSFFMILILAELLAYRIMVSWLSSYSRNKLAVWQQTSLITIASLISGVMVIGLIVLSLLEIKNNYPLKSEVSNSYMGRWVEPQLEYWHKIILGKEINQRWQ